MPLKARLPATTKLNNVIDFFMRRIRSNRHCSCKPLQQRGPSSPRRVLDRTGGVASINRGLATSTKFSHIETCQLKRNRPTLCQTQILMDELINLVVQKTGISQDDARKAVEVVVNALKSKLPAPIASHVDAFLSGGTSGGLSALESEAGE